VPPSGSPPRTIVQEATCGARDALGEAGAPLEQPCTTPAPGGRGTLSRVAGETVDESVESLGLAGGVTLKRAAR
jgi:hypothetical protein